MVLYSLKGIRLRHGGQKMHQFMIIEKNVCVLFVESVLRVTVHVTSHDKKMMCALCTRSRSPLALYLALFSFDS